MMVGRSDGRRADCPPSCNVRERAREPALFTHPRFYHSAGYCRSSECSINVNPDLKKLHMGNTKGQHHYISGLQRKFGNFELSAWRSQARYI